MLQVFNNSKKIKKRFLVQLKVPRQRNESKQKLSQLSIFYRNKFLIFFFPFLFISLCSFIATLRAAPFSKQNTKMFWTPLWTKFNMNQWHALGREEQAKYYELARRERQLHMQMYPDWSSRTNATRGKKRKRKQEPNDGGTNTLTKLTHTFNCFLYSFFATLLYEIWWEN